MDKSGHQASDATLADFFAHLAASLNDDTFFSGLRLDLIEAPLPFASFSVRLTNCLRNNEIYTVGHLLAMVYEDCAVRGLGIGTRRELNCFLNAVSEKAGTMPFCTVGDNRDMGYFDVIKYLPPDETFHLLQNGVPPLPFLLENIVEGLFDDERRADYEIFARRVGIKGQNTHTLRELADLFGTPLMLMQFKYHRFVHDLIRFLKTGSLYELKLHPMVQAEFFSLIREIKSVASLLSDATMSQLIERRYPISLTSDQRRLLFFCLDQFEISNCSEID